MAKIERIYNVPLRKGFSKAPRYRKTKKAIIVLKEFLAKHMKCDKKDLRIGRMLNEKVWERSIKHPPHHVKVTVIKEDSGIVKAELFGFTYEEPIKPAEAKQEKKTETKEKEAPAEEKKAVKEPKEEKPKAKKAAEKPAEEAKAPVKEATKEIKAEKKAEAKDKPKAEKTVKPKKAPSKKTASKKEE